MKKTLILINYSKKQKKDYLTNILLLNIYLQNKIKYRLASKNFVKICLYDSWYSFYYNIILIKQFSAIKKILYILDIKFDFFPKNISLKELKL